MHTAPAGRVRHDANEVCGTKVLIKEDDPAAVTGTAASSSFFWMLPQITTSLSTDSHGSSSSPSKWDLKLQTEALCWLLGFGFAIWFPFNNRESTLLLNGFLEGEELKSFKTSENADNSRGNLPHLLSFTELQNRRKPSAFNHSSWTVFHSLKFCPEKPHSNFLFFRRFISLH